MRAYLTLTDVLALHLELLRRYGGAPGVRDMGAVEAAVFRPQCGYYRDIAKAAVALLESLLINHPFADGNKRVAFAACDVFLRINGWRLQVESYWLYRRMMLWLDLREGRFERITQDLQECIARHDDV